MLTIVENTATMALRMVTIIACQKRHTTPTETVKILFQKNGGNAGGRNDNPNASRGRS